MKSWPVVLDEFRTLSAVLAGKSIGRLGDGEFPHAFGAPGGRQDFTNGKLKSEMLAVLQEPHEHFICAIPTMAEVGPRGEHAPKYQNWIRHRNRYKQLLVEEMTYYSAFITRPDSAPWIGNKKFCARFATLWDGKRVLLVAKESNKIEAVVRHSAAELSVVTCPSRDAYAHIDEYERKILDARPDVAILSCGPTATVLARRLAGHVHTVDIGSAGGFLMKYLLGKGDGSRDAPVKVKKA